MIRIPLDKPDHCRPDYPSTGIKGLDAEHKALNLAFKVLEDSIRDRIGKPHELEQKILKLIATLETHIKHEEQEMDLRGYPGLKEHAKDHRYLLKCCDRLRTEDNFMKDLKYLLAPMKALERALINHMETHDTELARFIWSMRKATGVKG